MKTIRVTFPNASGRLLSGRLEMPIDGKPHAYALFAHCFTCTKNLTAISNIARTMSMMGIAVLRFDFTGLGDSEGEFDETGFSSNVSDLVSACEFLEKEYSAPEIAVGHSLGGTAVLMAAKALHSLKAIVTIGSPFDPAHVKHLIQPVLDIVESKGKAMVNIGGKPFPISREFVEELDVYDPETSMAQLDKALLLLHAPQDQVVNINNAAAIYKAAHHPKSFVSLDGADHLLSDKKDSQYTGEIIASWVKRYITIPTPEPINAVKRVAARIGPDALTTEIQAGRHSLLSDEPEEVGGLELGPTPYDLVVAGLGACTAMTLRLYADRKKWPLTNVLVHLSHKKIHEADSEKQDKKALLDHIWREIELEGDLSDAQRERLLEIAEKCPVHKTLHQRVNIISKLLPPSQNERKV